MKVTVLTPTFNRKEKLQKLWNSLQKQTVKEFEWLVVDDGSTDGTNELIAKLQEKSDFPMYYIYKDNGGKHTALNVGIQTIRSQLTFIVDSDDYVVKDAVESILKIHEKYRKHNTPIPAICKLKT